MAKLIINEDPRMAAKWKSYSKPINHKLKKLRSLIIEAAKESDIKEIEETLKWGEPSYLAKKGSTVRIDWKAKAPDQYAIFFKCTSKLVLTFKEVYGDFFNYETTRAIVFKMDEVIPEKELKQCITAALNYHNVKTLPNLGLK